MPQQLHELDEEEEAEAEPTVESEQSKLSDNGRVAGRRWLETHRCGNLPWLWVFSRARDGSGDGRREPLEKGEQGQVDPQITILVLPALFDDLRRL